MEKIQGAKILIYFLPRPTPQFKGHPAPGDWIIAEPRKAVSRGQTITWKAVGQCRKLELDLPAVFPEPRQLIVDGTEVSATVSDDASPGPYLYEAYVDGQLALGGSSPILIIDP
jgi:hypothetical protein